MSSKLYRRILNKRLKETTLKGMQVWGGGHSGRVRKCGLDHCCENSGHKYVKKIESCMLVYGPEKGIG